MELLTIRALWEWTTDSEWLQVRDHLDILAGLPRNCEAAEPEPCPECPEPEQPPPPPPQAGGPSPEMGRLGLTLEQLEDFFIMGSFLRGQLAWINGKLHFASDGCDGWCEVPVISGSSPSGLTPEAIKALTQGTLSLDGWIEAGSPPIAEVGNLMHDNPIYTTDSSLKCAKATAIVNEMWNVIAGFREMADELGGTTITVSGVAGLIAAIFSGGWSIAISIVGAIVGFLLDIPMADLSVRLASVEGNTVSKEELICDLVERMEPTVNLSGLLLNKMTAKDVQTALERFEEIVPHHQNVRDILGFFPIDSWIEVVSKQVVSTECGCDDFLPHGYTPPDLQGAIFNFDEMVYAMTINSSTLPLNDLAGLPFELLPLSPDSGQRLGIDNYRTTYSGADNAGGAANKYTTLAVLYQFSEPTDIDELRFDVALNNAPTGAFQQLHRAVATFVPASGWGVHRSGGGADGGGGIVLANGMGNIVTIARTGVTFMVFVVRTRNTDPTLFATITNIVLDGNIGGAGFMAIEEGVSP